MHTELVFYKLYIWNILRKASATCKETISVLFSRSFMMDNDKLKEVNLHLPEEILQEYREIFAVFDIDGRGTITGDKLRHVMRSFGWNPTERDLQVYIQL